MMTDVPGSSCYFVGGVVAYSNDVKQSLLKAPVDLITKQWGRSANQVAAAMADGARSALGSDYALSTTGIAGPGWRHGKPSLSARRLHRTCRSGRNRIADSATAGRQGRDPTESDAGRHEYAQT